ncbi:ABC transporter permease [Candidatus Igneacidithiobacillus taiwanensis]|uniref:ABC transporter permease n=1 Tax=Candidatus Igneacidithiobacillus taiwanensis TaxID=1945924 RepID=UPI00289D0467|nr:ABC transporter permease [Candidatus Igneacidithiobacillus taiwanensis]
MKALLAGAYDLVASLRAWRLWTLLGWVEIRQRYARSKLGPFWLTISMGVMATTLGLLYGLLFGQNLSTYLPMISIGIVMWGLFSGVVNDGCNAFIAGAGYIKQIPSPKYLFVLQVAWRNLVIFLHNFIIVLIVLAIFGIKSWVSIWLFFPGLLLFVLNAMWMASFAGVVAARFRDFPQIVASLLQVAFYVSPILFHGEMLSKKHQWVIELNPIAYLIDIVRQPLLGIYPAASAWVITGGMAFLGWGLALAFAGRYIKRIPYWV